MNRQASLDARVDWILLCNTMLGNFLAGFAARIFAISLPAMAHSLETDIVGISWALLSFEISVTSLSVVFGRIGDLYGRKSVYGFGMFFLTVSSFLCGVSQNIFQLIVFRLLQGAAAAMTQSVARAMAMEAMPESSAGKSQGLMSTAFATGSFLGPSLGGLIIDYIHWRGIFFFLVPIGALGTFLTFSDRKRRRSVEVSDIYGPKPTVDYLGAGLLMFSTVIFMCALNQRVVEFMSAPQRVFLLLAFIGLFTGFLLREGTAKSPMINLALFKIRMFSFSSASCLLVAMIQGLTYLIMPFYLQDVLSLSPSFIGVLFMTTPFFTIALSPAMGQMSDRTGPRLPATAGIIMHATSLLIGTALRVDSHWLLPTSMLAFSGMGSALFNSPNHSAMIGSVPKDHRGLATGLLHLLFSLGMILGISLSTFLMTTLFRFYTATPNALPNPLQPAAFVSALNGVFGMGLLVCLAALVASVMRGSKFRPGSGSET